jgi:hypothetical protein
MKHSGHDGRRRASVPIDYASYAAVGFGEASSTLWVWILGLPKNSLFLAQCGGQVPSGRHRTAPENKILERLAALKPPARRVTT